MAFSTGADWAFPDNLPGGWQHEEDPLPTPPPGPERASPKPASPSSRPDESANRPKRRRKHWPPRTCRICLDVVHPTYHFDENPSLPASLQPAPRVSYISEDGGRLLRPCKCKGTQKYVHEECLSAWRRADPLQKRNYWECPTCRYRYGLQRLAWAAYVSSTAAQVGLTLLIFLVAMFALGFVADPIINLYLDPITTITTAGGPSGSLVFEDEPAGWTEHFVKGLASLGLLGFAKFIFTLSPFNWFNVRTGGFMGGGGVARSGIGGTGRERLNQSAWIAIVVGIVTFLIAVWRGVRTWSRRTLEAAGERVLDVPGDGNDDEDEDGDEPDGPKTDEEQ